MKLILLFKMGEWFVTMGNCCYWKNKFYFSNKYTKYCFNEDIIQFVCYISTLYIDHNN